MLRSEAEQVPYERKNPGSRGLDLSMKSLSILHCDMNAFYASVEIAENPSLRGLPLAVCGSREERRGIVLAKSQEARVCGVKTGDIIAEARGKCPNLVIVPPRYEKYLAYSKAAKNIYYRYTDRVESFGPDECWLEIGGSLELLGKDAPAIADELRGVIRKELHLTISVGVSFNKNFAKLGSDYKKPDATTVIREEDVPSLVWRLPVSALLGVGPAMERRLHNWGISTIGDLARSDPELLRRRLGLPGYKLWRNANGWDDAKVRKYGESSPAISIGHGMTLRRDLQKKEEIWAALLHIAEELGSRLRADAVRASRLELSYRLKDLTTMTLRTALPYPSNCAFYLAEQAMKIFESNPLNTTPVRALTLRATDLIPISQPLQINFFSDAAELAKRERIEDVIYALRAQFGNSVLDWGIVRKYAPLPPTPPRGICPPGLPD